jgi:uncharacterized membrane protein
MSSLIMVLATAALLGAALVGGIFFAFSSFIMKALARVPLAEGIGAMQSINVVVINPTFLAAFMGTALLSVVMAGLAVSNWGHPQAALFLAGAISYLVGTFLVTMMGNVPLNDRLAATPATDGTAAVVWQHYLNRWLRWNHLRTLAAMLAALLFTLGLVLY